MFESQLPDAVRKYPNLKINQDKNGYAFLKGVLDIRNDVSEVVDNFLIEIHCSEKFPYRFPILLETGGRIPIEADWHRNINGSCCITVPADEIVKCKNGMSVLAYIEKYSIPYFANQVFRIQEGKYKNGAYGHNSLGVYEFYVSLMKTSDSKLWVKYLEHAFGNVSVSCGRNDHCFCGLNAKYKNCHLQVFDTLRLIGKEQILLDFEKLRS